MSHLIKILFNQNSQKSLSVHRSYCRMLPTGPWLADLKTIRLKTQLLAHTPHRARRFFAAAYWTMTELSKS